MREYDRQIDASHANINDNSVTRHQQHFGTRNTKINGRNNVALITQSVIGTAWRLPERSTKTGVAMRRELIVNVCVY
jgi:hypothetical protein